MKDQLELFNADGLLKKPEKKTSGLHMDVELYNRAAELGQKEGLSTNAVLVQLIKIGLKVVESAKGGN